MHHVPSPAADPGRYISWSYAAKCMAIYWKSISFGSKRDTPPWSFPESLMNGWRDLRGLELVSPRLPMKVYNLVSANPKEESLKSPPINSSPCCKNAHSTRLLSSSPVGWPNHHFNKHMRTSMLWEVADRCQCNDLGLWPWALSTVSQEFICLISVSEKPAQSNQVSADFCNVRLIPYLNISSLALEMPMVLTDYGSMG